MITIRKNVFETNSSSTHSLVMAEKSEFDKWENGEVLYCNCWWSSQGNRFEEGKFYPKEEVENYYKEKDEERDPYEFCTYDEFMEDEYLETSEYTYVTPQGETIKAVAKYGYDG